MMRFQWNQKLKPARDVVCPRESCVYNELGTVRRLSCLWSLLDPYKDLRPNETIYSRIN